MDLDKARRKQLKNQYRAQADQEREELARLERERNERAWDVLHRYLTEATPFQRHVYAAQYNYDGNRRALEFLLSDPKTDRSTAIMIFWMLGADYYSRVSEEEVPDFQRETDALVWTIERRVREGFYQTSTIKFDPWSLCVHPGEYESLGPIKRSVSEFMYQRIDGEIIGDNNLAGFDDGLPESVTEALRRAMV